MSDRKGYVHIYTGDGKGKTTAALGLVCRAVGAGWKILFTQFLKKGRFSEIEALDYFGNQVKTLQFGSGKFVRGKPVEEDVKRAQKGITTVSGLVNSCEYDMVVLDEINFAVNLGLVDISSVVALIENRPEHVEIVLTGRNAPETLCGHADLITRCESVKHYYDFGVKARTGIEK